MQIITPSSLATDSRFQNKSGNKDYSQILLVDWHTDPTKHWENAWCLLKDTTTKEL